MKKLFKHDCMWGPAAVKKLPSTHKFFFVNYNCGSKISRLLLEALAIFEMEQVINFSQLSKPLLILKKTLYKVSVSNLDLSFFSKPFSNDWDNSDEYVFACGQYLRGQSVLFVYSYTLHWAADISTTIQVVFMEVSFCCRFESARSIATHLPDSWPRTDLNLLWL